MEPGLALRCMVMNEVAEGLMARLSFMKRKLNFKASKPQCLNNPDWAKLRSKLESTFGELGDMSKIANYETFVNSAGMTMTELHNFYSTFVDIAELRDTSHETILDIATSFRTLKMSVNPGVTRAFMRLIVNFVKLHYMLASIAEVKVLLSMYALAFKVSNNRTEDNYQRLCVFVNQYEDPLKQIFEDLKARNDVVRDRLEDIVIEVNDSMEAAFAAEASIHTSSKNMLDPLAEVATLALPTLAPLSKNTGQNGSRLYHTELVYVDEYLQWIIFGGLVCPQLLLKSPRVLEIFKTAASDCLVLPIYRDLVLNVHEKLKTLATWFPKKVSKQYQAPKGLKLDKIMDALGKEAPQTCGKKHKERLSYVTGELEKLTFLLQTIPGIVGPKFPVVLATLAMAQSEVLWLFRHQSILPAKSSKTFDIDDFSMLELPDTIRLYSQLVEIVRSHASVVQDYYREYLSTTHASMLEPELVSLRTYLQNSGPKVGQILDSLTTHMQADVASPPAPDTFEALRLNWLRIESVLTGEFTATTLPAGADMRSIAPSIARMQLIVEHSRFVDNLDATLERYGQLSDCWWFRDDRDPANKRWFFKEVFQHALSSGGTNGRACISFLHVISCNVCALHEYSPEEHVTLREESAQKVDELLTAIVDTVGDLLTAILEQTKMLSLKADPMEAAKLLQRSQAGASRPRKGAESAESIAGSESFPRSRSSIGTMVQAEANLAEILCAVNKSGTIPVFNFTYAPREYVRLFLIKYFRDFVNRTVRAGGQFDRPSTVVRKLSYCCSTLQKAATYVELDIAYMFRQVLFEASFEQGSFGFGDAGATGASAATEIAQFYVSMMDAEDLVYSVMNDAFVKRAQPVSSSRRVEPSATEFENYLDRHEVHKLSDIVGLHGIRILDESLVQYSSSHIETMQGVVRKNKDKLMALRNTVVDGDWEPVVASMEDLDQLVEGAVRVGNACACRDMVSRATNDAAQTHIPFVLECAQAASRTTSLMATPRAPPELHAVSKIWRACGVQSCGDVPLWNVVQPMQDESVWAMFPAAFAATFTSDKWRGAQYNSEIDGFANNAHVMLYAMNAVFSCSPSAVAASEEFLRISASVLLKLRLSDSYQQDKDMQGRLNAQFVFLEDFAKLSPADRSVLEQFVPYSVIHAARMDLARSPLGASTGGGGAAAEDDG